MPMVKLGEVAREYKETCKGDKGDLPIVGLEHLIPKDINLTCWSDDKENTFTKMFRKGHVLFGRRRAYLKKAAVAPFDGICSGDITVIEAIGDKLYPGLLPFIIQNDALFDFAVEKSAGSLSPRVKWQHLQDYEFFLPEMAKQKELAELLWAMDRTKQAYKQLISATDELVKSQFIDLFGNPISCEKDSSLPIIGDLCTLKAGSFVKADNISDSQTESLYPCYGGNGLRGYVSDYTHDGDYPIIGRQGALCGNVQYVYGRFHATEHAVVVTPKVKMDRYWLYYLLLLLDLNRYATGAAQPGLAVNKLEKIHISCPAYEEQKRYSAFARQTDKSKFAIQLTGSNLNF